MKRNVPSRLDPRRGQPPAADDGGRVARPPSLDEILDDVGDLDAGSGFDAAVSGDDSGRSAGHGDSEHVLPGTPLAKEHERTLVLAAQRGDVAAREQLVHASYRTVTWIARRYRGSGVPLEDMVSEGAIGVLSAIDRFDADRGTRFDTYARWWILDAVRSCVMRQSRTVRLPASVVKQIGAVDRALRAEDGTADAAAGPSRRASVIDRVAERLQRSGAQVEQLLALRESALSLDSIADRADESDDGATTFGAPQWSPEAVLAMKQIVGQLTALMDDLSERERLVLVSRYGLDTGEPLSLEALGTQLGLTAERVRQVQNEALAKLRAKFLARGLLGPGALA